MGVWLGPRGVPKQKKPPAFTYTGQHELFTDTRADGTVDWELVLKTSGKLTFSRVVDKVDVFAVGGGAPGADGYHRDDLAQAYGGNGGRGGAYKTQSGVDVSAGTAYEITIGGSNKATSGLGVSAATAGGGARGTGAMANDTVYSGTDSTSGGAGGYAFGSASTAYNSGYRYGAGGGGGGAKANNQYAKGGSSGGTSGGGDGGNNGGGGSAGSANSGGGGGGGSFYAGVGKGGAGGSGIFIIRNAR